ncbi:MAG: hypothetical protein K9M45_07855, partial [Kiritimatiellales bacterium]|nr:hypothetical protein [Kiritimatiellales bacterium]
EPRTRLALCRAVQRHLERSVSASFEPMAPGEKITLPVVGMDEHADEAGGAAELTGLQKWYNDPTVKLVLEAFNGEIVDIRE